MKHRAVSMVFAIAVFGCGHDEESTGTDQASLARATGEIGPWSVLAPMPVVRGNHCSVVANGYLVAIGGNYKPNGGSFENLDSVHVARLRADGTVGPWQLAGKTPSPVSSCTAAAEGNELFLIDGLYDDPNAGGRLYRATLRDDGMLSEWQDAGALPSDARVLASQAYVQGRTLYAFHALLEGSGDGVALAHGTLENGILTEWTDVRWSRGFRGNAAYALSTADSGSRFVYTVGGYAGASQHNRVLSDGAGALLDENTGRPGGAFALAELPKPTTSAKAIAVDGWLFVVGGKGEVMAGVGRSDVLSSSITGTGALSAWVARDPLPEGRVAHAVVVHHDYLYVVGGAGEGGQTDAVYSARVRFPER